jgi:N-acetylglucosaminyl-diphospho-decaprenol L-rhamnosyltransferase
MANGMRDFFVVIPVFNQLNYTIGCLKSLNETGVADDQIIVVDNGSVDGTEAFLGSRSALHVIRNGTNLGCSAAWNQGVAIALNAKAEWITVLNNDVVVAPGFCEGLLAFARESKCDIVSPAMGEGDLDYDLATFASEFRQKARRISRSGLAFGVCFMVQRRVFEKIGIFDTKLGQAGYEDEDFFRRARRAGFRMGTTGMAFLHHFGSVTQKNVKASLNLAQSARLGNRDYFRKKHGLNWFRRRANRLGQKTRSAFWRWNERRATGFTLVMRRVGGRWRLG